MLVPVLLFCLGLMLLIRSGGQFVEQAAAIAHRLRMPQALIGSTIVSLGTTLPEVMVSAGSALGGHGEIAYGNAVGSVICNAALIGGIALLAQPGAANGKALRLPMLFFFTAAAVFGVTLYTSGWFSRSIGAVLLVLLGVYLLLSVGEMRTPPPQAAPAQDGTALPMRFLRLGLSAALVAVGADLLVDNGILIAQTVGVPESVIGLTFVALGTSLPELTTALISLARGHAALSLGNILGANLLNLTLVSGLSAVLKPYAVPQSAAGMGLNLARWVDFPLMLLAMAVLCLPAMLQQKGSRWQGGVLLGLYLAFCAVQLCGI